MNDIPGYEGKYAATTDGMIWSYPKAIKLPNSGFRKQSGKYLKPYLTGDKGKQLSISNVSLICRKESRIYG